MSYKRETAKVISQEKIATNIYSICFEAPYIAREAVSGQFVNIYTNDDSRMLPRPFGICDTDAERGMVRVVYRVVGCGTKGFSELKEGDSIDVLGPLGKGFPLDKSGDSPVLVGGGTGIPIMLSAAKAYFKATGKKADVAIGFRDETFMEADFEQYACLHIATEDGSRGTKGNVLDAIAAAGLKPTSIHACGPIPMLRALKNYANEQNIPAYVSLEEKMACGIGACLACVCSSKDKDEHSNVNNKRICKEGPVFEANEIEF